MNGAVKTIELAWSWELRISLPKNKCLWAYLKQNSSFSYLPLFSFVTACLSCAVFLALAVKKIIR